jgi:NADP-dependent 3-hydroxy acid dehydrogenase YdfG
MTSTQKTALITGATSGFGVYIARYILEQGYRLLLWARTEQKGKDTLKQLQELSAILLPCPPYAPPAKKSAASRSTWICWS